MIKRSIEFFWRLASSRLRSGNIDKIFPIFTGSGDNSKTMLVRLFELAFCQYSIKIPTSFITEDKKDSDKPTPIMIHGKGAKIAWLQEPNKDKPIQSGTVKELTGNDTMYVRDLFQKGSNISEQNITFVPFLVANKIPMIPDCQQAIWERTFILEFLSSWKKKENAPKTEAEQFKAGIFVIDRCFDSKLPKMAPAFLWILFHKYEDYIENQLRPPQAVLQATEQFRTNNNYYIHFTRDNIRKATVYSEDLDEEGNPIEVTDVNARVSLDDLYLRFREWYSGQSFKDKIPPKSEFKDDIERTWRVKASIGEDNRSYWNGIELTSQKATIGSILGLNSKSSIFSVR